MEMQILTEGRKRIKTNVEQTEEKNIMIAEYDDGTILKLIQEADNTTVQCNKTLEVQPDGKTVKIID